MYKLKEFLLNNKNRINLIDVGKFLAILIIVLIHVLQRTVPDFTSGDNWLFRILLLSGVAPFFFFSAIIKYLRDIISA